MDQWSGVEYGPVVVMYGPVGNVWVIVGQWGCCMGNIWASRVMYGLVVLCIGQWGDVCSSGVMYDPIMTFTTK